MLFYELDQQIITKCWSIEITKILRAIFFRFTPLTDKATGSYLDKFEIGKTSIEIMNFDQKPEDLGYWLHILRTL